MLLKLQDIPVADALSRKFLSDTFPELSDSMDALVHSVMSSIPIYDTRLDETRVIMSADPQSHYEWLARQPRDCSSLVIELWNFRDELRVANDLSRATVYLFRRDKGRLCLKAYTPVTWV